LGNKHQGVSLSLAAAFLLHFVKELIPECPQLTGQLLATQTLQIHPLNTSSSSSLANKGQVSGKQNKADSRVRRSPSLAFLLHL
jgi:hypothetical protein